MGGQLHHEIPVSTITKTGRYKFFDLLEYEPRPGQVKFHDSEARFRVVSAASRMGKSTGAALEACAYAHLPNKMIWIVAPTYELSEKVFRVIWREMVEKRRYETVFKSYRDRKIKFAWGTEVYGRSCQNPESLLGEGVDFMVIDEASRIRPEVWNEYLRMRLIDKIGSALIISSPKGTNGWFPELYRRGQDDNFKDQWFSVACTLYDNPVIPLEEIEKMRRELPKEAFDQEVMGKFVPYGGLVYKEWSDKIHTLPEIQFNPDIPIILAVDFGTRNPCAALFCQRLGEKIFNVFDEYYVRGQITMEHAQAIRNKLRAYLAKSKHSTVEMYHDPSGLDESITFKKFIPELVTIPAVNDIVPGINTVRSFLMLSDDSSRPGILISRSKCPNTVWELDLYHYPKIAGLNRTESEVPVNVDNHALDALRYMLHTMAPVSSLPLNYRHLETDFSPQTICIQEAGDAYVREIDSLKSAFYAATKTPGGRR